MEKLFELKTKYTLKEHIQYNYAVAMHMKEVWFSLVLVVILLLYGVMASVPYAVIFAILYPIAFVCSIYFSAKKNYASNKAMQDADITIEFYEDHILQKTELGSYQIQHDKIDKIIETKTHFYIMISRNQGVLIPKENLPEGLKEHILKLK